VDRPRDLLVVSDTIINVQTGTGNRIEFWDANGTPLKRARARPGASSTWVASPAGAEVLVGGSRGLQRESRNAAMSSALRMLERPSMPRSAASS